MENMENKESRIEVFYLTESERLLIREMWGCSTDIPDWVYQKAKEQVVLDGLRAQNRL